MTKKIKYFIKGEWVDHIEGDKIRDCKIMQINEVMTQEEFKHYKESLTNKTEIR